MGAILAPWVAGWLQEAFPGPTAMFTAIEIAALIAAPPGRSGLRENAFSQFPESRETEAVEQHGALT